MDELLKQQVEEFRAVRPAYKMLADTLELILMEVRDRYCPMARVDSRVKSIASFAEKALRKRKKYEKDSPLVRMTDLAGARIVVYTLAEARTIRDFIENEPGLQKDWKNSLDMQQQMKTDEFGYNGVHYIVELCELRILGVPIPSDIRSVPGKRSFKAEIQIHTMLQNAWSVIGHDRLYKTQVKVPNAMKREIHAIAATLESVDKEFARSVESLDHYIRHFEAYRSPGELQDEIVKWTAIYEGDPKDPAAVHELGRCLMAALQWDKAYDVLKLPVLKDVMTAGVQRDIGQSAFRAPGVPVEEARNYLRTALDLDPKDVRSLCALANTYRSSELDPAISLYQKAFVIDPNEPAVLAPFVECHIRRAKSLAGLELMQGTFWASLPQCHDRACRGVYLPHAHFNCARLYLYLGRMDDALNSYCMAISACRLPEMISEELGALTQMLAALNDDPSKTDPLDSSQLAGFELARRLLVVALTAGAITWRDRGNALAAAAWKQAGESVAEEFQKLITPASSIKRPFPQPMVIVAGGCDDRFEKALARYDGLLRGAFEAFSGTILSGGTTAGISGMVGSLKPSPGRMLRRVAYLPKGPDGKVRLPKGDEVCGAYEVLPAPGQGYSPAGVLQAWADILQDNIRPSQVRILAINGGVLTGLELRLGLALGAVVGAAEDSGRIVQSLFEVRPPCRPDGLIPLPSDAATWAVFIRGASATVTKLTPDQLEQAARTVHEQFRKANETNLKKHDPSVFPWPDLASEYKDSNFDQVRFATQLLDAAGYDVVKPGPGEVLKPETPPVPADFESKIPAMAELEHGRFCAERLVAGWRYGPTKDLEHHLNPTIVPWAKLSPGDREFDFNAVRNFPTWLAAAGLKIVPRT